MPIYEQFLHQAPIVPSQTQRRMERIQCKVVQFHDPQHTFATMALEHGIDVKPLSTIIGHVSSATTLDIFSQVTDTLQKQAAVKIDHQIGKTDATRGEETTCRPERIPTIQE